MNIPASDAADPVLDIGRLAHRVFCGKRGDDTPPGCVLRKANSIAKTRATGLSLTSFIDPDKVLSLVLR